MGYWHMFYAVDLQQLRSIPGSKDLTLLEAIKREADSFDDEDEENENAEALRRIIMGECQNDPETVHQYGYALKAICEHIGAMIGSEVAAIRDHPYRSKLAANGPPIEIPYDPSDFPEIGYLTHDDLAGEYKLATESRPKAKRTLLGFILRKMTGGIAGREPNAEEVAEDMAMYAETLKECMDKGASLVSFRH